MRAARRGLSVPGRGKLAAALPLLGEAGLFFRGTRKVLPGGFRNNFNKTMR
jgi:hypothetical protein